MSDINIDWEDVRRRTLGAYLGLAVGDALGATVEFMTVHEIEAAYGMHRNMIGGGWLKLKPGHVTDDTQMSLALGESLLQPGEWNIRNTAEAFVRWFKTKPVDIGNTCRRGIQRYLADASLIAPANAGDAGNGACMRNLPLSIATLGDSKLFSRWTLAQAHLTHQHPLSDAGTLALGRMTQQLILGKGIKACRNEANRLLAEFPLFRFEPYPRRAGAYIVETVQTVLYYFFRSDSFESCVTQVINRGEDADTTGALAGMLCGAAYGIDTIPHYWLKKLDKHIVHKVTEQSEALIQLARARLMQQ